MKPCIAALLLALVMAPLRAQEIQSGENRLAVDPATGRISVLALGGRNLLGSPAPVKKRPGVLAEIDDVRTPGGPFRLHAPLPDFEGRRIDAANSKPAIEPAVGGKSLLLRYANLISGGRPTGIAAVVRIASGWRRLLPHEPGIEERHPKSDSPGLFSVGRGLGAGRRCERSDQIREEQYKALERVQGSTRFGAPAVHEVPVAARV